MHSLKAQIDRLQAISARLLERPIHLSSNGINAVSGRNAQASESRKLN
jgi:hypothetical protein